VGAEWFHVDKTDGRTDMMNLIVAFGNIANALINVTPCRLVKSHTFRSTAMHWRRLYAFTSTHDVTFHRTYQHQHRSDTFTSPFYTAVYMTWRDVTPVVTVTFNALVELRRLLQCDALCIICCRNVLPYRYVASVSLKLRLRYHVTHSWKTPI
jgi:hypothetical protein